MSCWCWRVNCTPSWPTAGQRMDYLVKALRDFRSGARRGRGMGAMMEVSVTLQDRDIDMIARYLAGKP